MRIAHVVVVTPHQAGIYETARDLVAAERALGVDARIIDPVKEVRGTERDVPLVGVEWANECQILVNHSGLGKGLLYVNVPVVHILHGRPYSSFLLEQAGKIPVYSYWTKVRREERFKAFVTFWKDFLPYFKLIFREKRLEAVPPPVDLERWTPDGPSGYNFHGHKGEINVVCADIWRRDKDPYHVINAFGVFVAKHPEARLHVYAAPERGGAWKVLKGALGENLGEVCGFIKGLDNVYRAADLLITPHRMATRSVRESLACGCTVVMAPGNRYTEFRADPEDLEGYAAAMSTALRYGNRRHNRKVAESCFDSQQTARAFIRILREVGGDGIR